MTFVFYTKNCICGYLYENAEKRPRTGAFGFRNLNMGFLSGRKKGSHYADERAGIVVTAILIIIDGCETAFNGFPLKNMKLTLKYYENVST
jgi:hypothetical protein